MEDSRVTLVGSFANCVAFIAVQKDRKAIPRGLSFNNSQFKSQVYIMGLFKEEHVCIKSSFRKEIPASGGR